MTDPSISYFDYRYFIVLTYQMNRDCLRDKSLMGRTAERKGTSPDLPQGTEQNKAHDAYNADLMQDITVASMYAQGSCI